jgi:hypothetical protein
MPKNICVKCRLTTGDIKFPYSKIKAKVWSEKIAVPGICGQRKEFCGKKSHYLCQDCYDANIVGTSSENVVFNLLEVDHEIDHEEEVHEMDHEEVVHEVLNMEEVNLSEASFQNTQQNIILKDDNPEYNELPSSSNMLPYNKCKACEYYKSSSHEHYTHRIRAEEKLSQTIEDVIFYGEKVLQLNKLCEDLQSENAILMRKLEESSNDLNAIKVNLLKFLTEDQIVRLRDGVTKGRTYEEDTVTSSLALWFASGSVGYKYLQNKGLPLPSVSTLHKKLAQVSFPPGRAQQMNELLSRKVKKGSKINKNI